MCYELEYLLQDERFSSNEARVLHAGELDAEIEQAISRRTLERIW